MILERGALKEGKSGKYNSDYFENLVEVRGAPTPQGTPAARTDAGNGASRDSLGPGQGMAWGNALTNAFNTVHGMGVAVAIEDFDTIIGLARAIYNSSPIPEMQASEPTEETPQQQAPAPTAAVKHCQKHNKGLGSGPKWEGKAHEMPDGTFCRGIN